MTTHRFVKDQEVGLTRLGGTKVKGVVLHVTPTSGRATVKMTNPDGHSFNNTFSADGRHYPKRHMDFDGPLRPWTVSDEHVWREQVAESEAREARYKRQERKERKDAALNRAAMAVALQLLRKSRAPEAARAISVIENLGYRD